MTRQGAARGFTLIELLVVSFISLILMTVGATVYMKCLQVYADGQGLTQVHETAKLIERELRDYFGNVAPVKGSWINSTCVWFPGGNYTNYRNYSYYTFGSYGHGNNMHHTPDPGMWTWWWTPVEPTFSGPQYGWSQYDTWNHVGYSRSTPDAPANWGGMDMHLGTNYGATTYNASWWAPAFFGYRDPNYTTGAGPKALEVKHYEVGSWGWPRPDYRLDADADDITIHNLISCWFYTEDRNFGSPLTLALDNANLMLVSLKFSMGQKDGQEFTQLSLLKHHISGWDQPGQQGANVRADMNYGDMLRAIKVTPLTLDAAGNLVAMTNADLGVDLKGTPIAGGDKTPRCFDIKVTLRHPRNLQRYDFAFRYYNHNTPQ